ncbi:phage baseplate assembly protein V [Serratia ureilytica]
MIGTVSELDLERGAVACRHRRHLPTGSQLADRTGRRPRSWWAPSIGEGLGAVTWRELETACVARRIFGCSPPPSASAQAAHNRFPDGAVLEYEPATGALKAVGMCATIEAAERITPTAPNITCIASGKSTLDAPEVECTQYSPRHHRHPSGGSMTGDSITPVQHRRSNGIVVTPTLTVVQNGRRPNGQTSMNNAKFLGMNRGNGRAIADLEHIRQSVSDILITPIGSRVMRRSYGSLLSELLDQPQNDTCDCK